MVDEVIFQQDPTYLETVFDGSNFTALMRQVL